MRPILFSILGLDVQTYGVSKAAAAIVAAYVLARAFRRHGLARDDAYGLVTWATVWGFVGAKIYFILERLPDVTPHDLGGSGFTWYGGLLGGTAAALIMIRRRHLPFGVVVDATAVPLSLAYAIGRAGCWFSGDGTYGKPTTLPWGMKVTAGMLPSDVAVHPTPLYEAGAALIIAALLWALSRRAIPPFTVFAAYLVLSGVARFGVELLRTNPPAWWGLTQPQLWSVVSVAAGIALATHALRRTRPREHAHARDSSSNVNETPVDPAVARAHTGGVPTP